MKLKKITCDSACGFQVRSQNEKELLQMTKEHAKMSHPGMKMSESDIKSMMTAA